MAKQRILCAMSGGVDSSVTARLLLDQGYEVVGVTMLLDAPSEAESPEVRDAKGVAYTLGIDHICVDYRTLFEQRVKQPFCRAYCEGLTPNPCIECNKYLKFEALQKLRSEMGFDYVATGHYAQIRYSETYKRFELYRANDPGKDQSYVLYHLSQEYLAHTLFPLGGYTKAEVRILAQEAGFSNAQKAESQDICFIPSGDYATFIETYQGYTPQEGPIVTSDGKKLGTHKGLLHYTIGQRKGLGVAVGEPLFVLGKDIQTNALVVGRAEEANQSVVKANQVVFPSDDEITFDQVLQAKINYRARLRSAHVEFHESILTVQFDEPLRAAAPGQALVVYEGDRVVAGGTIIKTY